MTAGQSPFLVGGRDFRTSDTNNNNVVDQAEIAGFNAALQAAGLPAYTPPTTNPPTTNPPTTNPPTTNPPTTDRGDVPPSEPAKVPDPDITKKNADNQRKQQVADNYATGVSVQNAEDKLKNNSALDIAAAMIKEGDKRGQVFKA
jgi:hypothetical protein